MKNMTTEEIEQRLKSLKTLKDVTSFTKELVAPTIQRMLDAEMENHLGYPKHHPSGINSGNSRNGHSGKTLKGSFGTAEIAVPRDRNGEFEPIVVKKNETIESDIEERIISMYGKGMSTRDINEHVKDIYGVEVSSTMISNITEKVMPLVKDWQTRPLESLYPIVYLDGIRFKVRDAGRVINKCGYTILGVNQEGIKELLGIWLEENEGAKFWLQVLNELKNRGVEDILICCIDGLKGFPDAIKAVYPEADIQLCIIHQVRNTTKYIPHKLKKSFCSDLKLIYTAPTEEAGMEALQEVKEKWPQYKLYLKSWENKWPELSTFFVYPDCVRKIIYTTNAVESLHRQFRKVTKTSSIFPHDEALVKLLWLAQRDISRKWNKSLRNWGEIIAQFAIMYPERINLT